MLDLVPFPMEAAEGLGAEIVADLGLWLVSRGCELSGDLLRSIAERTMRGR
jgi:hypothetical protein